MSHKLLHRAEIHSNLETFDGSTTGAVGAGGGFPCQAWAMFSHPGKNGIQILYPSSVQDISQAGNQEGMAGARSSLVKHVFRVFDTLAKGQLRPMGRKFQFQSVLHFFNFLSMAQASHFPRMFSA
jgi:site-specific DNA-cytosine methylase